MSQPAKTTVAPRLERFPFRLARGLLPAHTLRVIRPELHLAWLRFTRRGIDRRFRGRCDLLVNVGSGRHGRDGWVNMDCYRAAAVTCLCDCRTALPLPTGSARGIFTEHFLEHLDYYEEAPRFLFECRRVLAPGGVVRIIVPDGGRYLQAYLSDGWSAMEAFSPLVDHQLFETKMEVVNAHFRQGGQHHYSYDVETLSLLLRRCGFEDIAERGFRSSSLTELAIDADHRASESLVVEARAPS